MAEWFRADGVNRRYYYKEEDQNAAIELQATNDCDAFKEAAQYVVVRGAFFEQNSAAGDPNIPDFRIANLTKDGDVIRRSRPEIAD